MKRLVIIGASGHGKVCADVAVRCGYNQIDFLDDNEELTVCGKWPVVGKCDMVAKVECDIFVAIGNADIRRKIIEKYSDKIFVTLIHPNSVIANGVIIGKGSVVMAGVVINSEAKIGDGCIINTCSSVDHDCVVGDYSHISVGTHLGGTVYVGESVWIGAGATVINNVEICDNCVIGAGTVVIKDIMDPGTYVGVPAKRVRN